MIKKYYTQYKEIINYIIVGGLTTAVSLGSYYICVFLFLDPSKMLELQFANIISWICAVTFAFFTNRKYVFESENSHVALEAFKFFCARVTTLFIDMICMGILVSIIGVNDKISKILVQFIVFVLNYVFSKFMVFVHK